MTGRIGVGKLSMKESTVGTDLVMILAYQMEEDWPLRSFRVTGMEVVNTNDVHKTGEFYNHVFTNL